MSYISTLYDSYTAVHPFLKQPILRMIDLMCVRLPTCWPILTINWPISHRSGMLDPTSRARLGSHMFARARSGGCFCSFYLCFHEVVPIWYISFFCDCFTDIGRILNDRNWTLLVISVGSDAPSLGTLFSQVIAAQMKTWFDGMHVYLLKPQVQKHEFCHIPKLWLTLACLWKMFFFMFFSGPLSNSPFDLPCFVRSSSTQDGRT